MHADCGRCEGVVGREHQRAPVLSAGVGSVGRAGEDVVPFENVCLGGMSDDIWGWVLLDVLVFAGKALVGCLGGHGEVVSETSAVLELSECGETTCRLILEDE